MNIAIMRNISCFVLVVGAALTQRGELAIGIIIGWFVSFLAEKTAP